MDADIPNRVVKGSFVRIPDFGGDRSEGLHPGHTYVIPTIAGSVTLRDGAQLNLWVPTALSPKCSMLRACRMSGRRLSHGISKLVSVDA